METDNKALGKINKKKCYLNNGKYGHYLTLDSKNYKVPEWFPVEKMDIDIAERLIDYKIKMSEQWLESTAKGEKSSHTKTNKKKVESESESEDEEELPKPSKTNKK
jgi:topoisomerase IA-like protein